MGRSVENFQAWVLSLPKAPKMPGGDPYDASRYMEENWGMPLMKALEERSFRNMYTQDLDWLQQPNFGLPTAEDLRRQEQTRRQNSRQLNGNVPGETRTRGPIQELRRIRNLFENPQLVQKLKENPDEYDNSTWTRGLDQDDLVNAAIRHYSMPTLQEYFGTTNVETIRRKLAEHAGAFLKKNANNSDDAGWDEKGVTSDDLAITEQKLAVGNIEITDPRFAKFLQDHFSSYARGGLFNYNNYMNKDELKRAIDDWNNSRYAQMHGQIIYNDHILGEKLNEIAELSNDEFGDEDDIHLNDLARLLQGKTAAQMNYDIPRQTEEERGNPPELISI